MKQKNDGFSVSLGLVDYINPILYTITIITIITNMKIIMTSPFLELFIVGASLSLIFGFVIPTGKLIVGLGIIKFRMPVSLVFLVNSGIFLSGMMLMKTIFNWKTNLLIITMVIAILLLIVLYWKTKKFNTIAVLIGAIGYLSIYISLIGKSIQMNHLIPIILYSGAILLFIMLCGIGIKANLKDPKVHWVIELSNVFCQFLVAIGTILLWK